MGKILAMSRGLGTPSYAARDTPPLSVRLEYYQQTPDRRLAGLGSLQGLDLYPGPKAILVQIGWRF